MDRWLKSLKDFQPSLLMNLSEVQTSKTGSHKIFLNYRRLFPWLGIIIIPTLGLWVSFFHLGIQCFPTIRSPWLRAENQHEPALSHGIVPTEIATDLFQNGSELNISILRSIKWVKMSAHIDPSGSSSSFNHSQHIFHLQIIHSLLSPLLIPALSRTKLANLSDQYPK